MMQPAPGAGAVLAELGGVFARLPEHRIGELVSLLADAQRVVCAGQGRSGLVAAALAVRLVHLGVPAHVAGEATQPAIGRGDLLLIFSRTGTTAIALHQAERARAAGARVAAITAREDSPLTARADAVLLLPVFDVPSGQHAGSLFEQAALITADVLAAALKQALAVPDDAMSGRHDNLQ